MDPPQRVSSQGDTRSVFNPFGFLRSLSSGWRESQEFGEGKHMADIGLDLSVRDWFPHPIRPLGGPSDI